MEPRNFIQRFARRASLMMVGLEDRLSWAAMDGDAGKIENLVREGARIDWVRVSKMPSATEGTALHLAVCAGHVAATQKLLDLGADPNRRNALGYTPLAAWFSKACTRIRRGAKPEHYPENDLRTALVLLRHGGDWDGHISLKRDIFMDAEPGMQKLEAFLLARMAAENLHDATPTPSSMSRPRMRI